MKEEITKTPIAQIISESFTPGTREDFDNILDIEDFIELWEDGERPILSEIEKAMMDLGFKNEESRIQFGFYVKIQSKNEEEAE